MKIILAAGGTGGHIFPAMAVAQEIKEKSTSCRLLWITTARANEREIADRFSIEMMTLDVEGIVRKFSFAPIRAIIKFLSASVFMCRFFKKDKPDAVIAFGGYVCAAVLLAARLNKIPFFIQEQNTVMGVVNRFFAKDAQKIFLGMPLVRKLDVQESRVVVSGTPTRKKQDYTNFIYPQAINKDMRTILICGGSQGAVSMNRVLVKAAKWFLTNNFQVVWQTGAAGEKEVENELKNYENAVVFASIPDLYPYYSIATFLIGRAGASTISEAQLFGLPSIFIPLPWSAENHQWHNAQFAQNCGWALCLQQDENTSQKIIDFVQNCEENTQIYDKIKECVFKNGNNAAKIIAETVL
jgi:UDP-N-acetylglucosamine--N-acetylmuramyl-(pentapeptide) pyrophosphoryl-undecaprenol N-acetylglucosamine transferase